jgi:hypothetical protein
VVVRDQECVGDRAENPDLVTGVREVRPGGGLNLADHLEGPVHSDHVKPKHGRTTPRRSPWHRAASSRPQRVPAPWCPRNERYATRERAAFDAGSSPDDFPAEHYERDWDGRFAAADLNETGRRGLGLD